jgi:hypothetical protein
MSSAHLHWYDYPSFIPQQAQFIVNPNFVGNTVPSAPSRPEGRYFHKFSHQ